SIGSFGWLANRFCRGDELRWHYSAALIAPSLSYLITHVDLRYRYPTVPLGAFVSCQLAAEMKPFLYRSWLAFRTRVYHSPSMSPSRGETTVTPMPRYTDGLASVE